MFNEKCKQISHYIYLTTSRCKNKVPDALLEPTENLAKDMVKPP